MESSWTKTDRILYGIMAGGVVLWSIAMFIEACRTRPKVKVIMLGVSGKSTGKAKEVKQPAKTEPENQ